MDGVLGKPKETYSTEKAWGYSSSDQAETVYWRNMAESLRKEIASQRMYIEKLEQKIESLESLDERASP